MCSGMRRDDLRNISGMSMLGDKQTQKRALDRAMLSAGPLTTTTIGLERPLGIRVIAIA